MSGSFPRASERRFLLIVGVCQTFSHLHIFSSSHPHIFTSSHLHIFSSSHLLIITSSHPHILTSSHPHIFTSSHRHIFSSSHLHILTSSHLHIFTFSLALLPSCSLALFFFLLFYFSLKARGSANETARNATLSHETSFDRQKTKVKLRFYNLGGFRSFCIMSGTALSNWSTMVASSSCPAARAFKVSSSRSSSIPT